METAILEHGLLDADQAGRVAEAIYTIVSGADNRQERRETMAALVDWLREGSFRTGETLNPDTLAAEWREFAEWAANVDAED